MNEHLPAIATAKLPGAYERAKASLENCAHVDECADWANKAEAIASYARQSRDESLLQTATRIKARATRRCGELLSQIKPAHGAGGGRPSKDPKLRGGRPPDVITRAAAAKQAGLSPDRRKQALQIAAIPKRDFEAAVESPRPPSVPQLATRGKKPPPPQSRAHLRGRDPKDYALSTRAQGALRAFAEVAKEIEPKVAVRGSVPHEWKKMAAHASAAFAWLSKLQLELEKVS